GKRGSIRLGEPNRSRGGSRFTARRGRRVHPHGGCPRCCVGNAAGANCRNLASGADSACSAGVIRSDVCAGYSTTGKRDCSGLRGRGLVVVDAVRRKQRRRRSATTPAKEAVRRTGAAVGRLL